MKLTAAQIHTLADLTMVGSHAYDGSVDLAHVNKRGGSPGLRCCWHDQHGTCVRRLLMPDGTFEAYR